MAPKSWLFLLLAALCLTPWATSATALFVGILFGLTLGNPWPERQRVITHRLLTSSVVGLGAGMNLVVIGRVGAHGVLYTAVGIVGTLALGLAFGRALQLSRTVTTLLSVGTAICGGSAIAAVAPVIRAKHEEVSVSLATVFFLNAVALAIFPWIGHHFSLDQTQFGLWAALAIHDTSSVVGAAMQYGKEALEIATPVKLARALWIIPTALAFGLITSARMPAGESDGTTAAKPRRPWFILGFLVASALVTWVPPLRPAGAVVETVARRALVLTLFFIGTSLDRNALRAVGARPLILGLGLWMVVGTITLFAIISGWIGLG